MRTSTECTALAGAAVPDKVPAGRQPVEFGLPLMLTVNQVAAMLGCSTRHVYRMSDAGKMPVPMKLGNLVRWSRQGIEEWIEAGCPAMRSIRGGKR